MRGRYLVCLGGGLESVPMLQRVKAAGLKVALVDANGHCPGFDLADTFSEASCYDAGETVAALTVTFFGLHLSFPLQMPLGQELAIYMLNNKRELLTEMGARLDNRVEIVVDTKLP